MNITEIATIAGTVIGALGATFLGMITWMKKQGFFNQKEQRVDKIDINEWLHTARQAGKEEMSPFISQFNKKLDDHHRDLKSEICEVKNQLKILNSKVATNVQNINKNAVEIARLQGQSNNHER